MRTPRQDALYAELSCQSAFSFQRGASEPESLVERAAELGYAALALTDRDALYGSPRLHVAGRAASLPVVHGTTLTLERSLVRNDNGRPAHADDRLVLLAENDLGWRSLCRLVSAARGRDRKLPCTAPSALLAEHAGLLALPGPHLPEHVVEQLVDGFGAGQLALAVHDRLLKRDRRGQQVQRARAARFGLPLVVTGGVRFTHRGDKVLHDVLACVRHGVTLEEAGTRLLPNAEFCLRPIARIQHLFRDHPEALAQSVELAHRCRFDLGSFSYRFPRVDVPPGETAFSVLHAAVQAGAAERYRPMTAAAAKQLAHELDVIERLGMAGYFLLVHDIVRFCEREQILCQGRGSAANSAVCYVLGITSVDPVSGQLLFERFLSEERGEWPDIDIDIAHQDRERVLQYVYARYGRDHAALAAEVITYRARSAVRDAAKAFGFDTAEVDRLAKSVGRRFDADRDGLPEGWEASDPRLPLLLSVVKRMCGLPRHLSIHVGGMIITGEPLTDSMPVEPAAMPGRTVIPWDKDDLGGLGVLKIDLLGLGMLTVLDRCLRSLETLRAQPGGLAPPSRASPQTAAGGVVRECGATRGECADATRASDAASAARPALPVGGQPFALHTIPTHDEATWDLLCAADTVGVFQVESRAQMNCLPRLRPRKLYDLVVEVALIRPGPIQGDMVHPYLRRRAGREPSSCAHPLLEPILGRTLGVPLFQEQGMRIAVEVAGFSPGEADELRRAMGHKRSHARMAALSERLLAGLAARGIPKAAAEQIHAQMISFADFGFPESHAASFARLAWVSAWLKCHWPAPFLCALLNAQPMGFYAPAVLVSDAERHGVIVLPVDVTQSAWDSSLQWHEPERGDAQLAVRLGFHMVRGFGPAQEDAVRRGLTSQERLGPFTDPADVARRLGLDTRQMEALARLGALRAFDTRRRQALWEVAKLGHADGGPLATVFPDEGDVALRDLRAFERVCENYRQGGASPTRHLMRELRPKLTELDVWTAREIVAGRRSKAAVARGARDVGARAAKTRAAAQRSPSATRSTGVRAAGLAICRQMPPTAGGLCFVTLEDETGFVNLIVTPEVGERCRDGLRAPMILAEGPLERADGVVNLRAKRLWPLWGEQLEGLASHDYH
ncbi:MAG: error-prone DNA polymerase [Planctomycetota bacterium]|nr:MAG: error-prone DNA polymerase [Planctomycetota bacterium]